MRLWRISHPRCALDRLCAGAALHGGRWNPIGMPALYAGTTIAITALEKFVHIGSAPLPPLLLVAIDIPDSTTVFDPGLAGMPPAWAAMPTSATAQALGKRFLSSGAELAMKVPSAIIPEEFNIVINPQHPDYANVGLSVVRRFTFDTRMFKSQ
ncbi:RES family NAD+ phosphorylase [Oxalobacteraceae bacterium]|nr:RES family NAD+ phosphorylase [Oxalobacteraceae bacterium]